MTIWISRELPLLNYKRIYILCAWIGPPSEKLWPFELLKSFHCSISSVSIYYAPESDIRVKSYDHLNFSRASVVQYRVSWCIMRLNLTSDLKVMTIWNYRELPLFNFERLDILCAWIEPPCERLWPLEFLESFRCSIASVSLYYAPESDIRVKVMTIWIFWVLPVFNFERLDILCAWIGPPSEKLWVFELLKSFHCSISSVSIYYAPESELRVKSYDHLNFSRASVVQFRTCRYIMHLNRTSELKVMTIWIFRENPLFNYERLYILCALIGPPSEKLWLFELLKSFHCSISSVSIYYAPESDPRVKTFEFLESFRCSISNVSIHYAPESDLRVKSYDHLNFSRASVVQLQASRYIMRLNRTSEWKVMTIWISRELPLFSFERVNILCAWIGPPS